MNINDHFKNYRNQPCDRYLIELLKESQFLIFGIVYKIINHQQDAEDLTQEVLIKIIQNINVLPSKTNFIGWLSKVSLNTAINKYQQKKRSKTLLTSYQEIQNNQIFENEDEKLAIIYQHLAKLDDIEQSMVINKHVNQLTISQLGQLYHLPDSTIELKIKKIVSKLKSSIEKAGFASVGLGVQTTFDQMKKLDMDFDLVSNVNKYFPTSYPKSKIIYSKLLVGAILVLTFVSIFFGIEKLMDTDLQKNHESVNLISNENHKIKPKEVNFTPTENHPVKPSEANEIKEDLPTDNLYKTKINPNAKIQEINTGTLTHEYAGQLLDAATKKPIADAKVEIWDIYTYEKYETQTDLEGKYSFPEILDTTFFFYLKFIKEGFITKQTFQHFEIHKNILIYMSTGRKVECSLNFNKSTSGEIYLGSNINLNNELYLSTNQKLVLKEVFNSLLENGPIELYTLKKINLYNTNKYTINEILPESYDYPPINFGIWYEGKLKKGQFGIYKSNLCALYEEGPSQTRLNYKNIPINNVLKLGGNKSNLYELILMQTGKPFINNELVVIDKQTKMEKILNLKNSNIIDEPEIDLVNSILIYKGNNYYAKYDDSQFSISKNNQLKINIIPYTCINFDPMSLENRFKDTQVIGCGMFFSKKSIFNKIKDNFGYFKIYDKFFENLLSNSFICASVGGKIDINSEINLKEYRKISISILINDQPLKEKTLYVHFLDDEETSDFKAPILLDVNIKGISEILMPYNTQKINLNFTSDGIVYSKVVNLNQIVNDNIVINFNHNLIVELSNEAKESYASALRYNKIFEGLSLGFFEGFYLKNEHSSIRVPFNQKTSLSLFVEKDTLYTISDGGYGLMTNFNVLKALKPNLINSNIEKIELKLESKFDYSVFSLEVFDDIGNEINTNNWIVIQDVYDESLNFLKTTLPNSVTSKPLEFLNKNHEVFNGKDQTIVDDILLGDKAISCKKINLLNNRNYVLYIFAEGYIKYFEKFSTFSGGNTQKKIILKKTKFYY